MTSTNQRETAVWIDRLCLPSLFQFLRLRRRHGVRRLNFFTATPAAGRLARLYCRLAGLTLSCIDDADYGQIRVGSLCLHEAVHKQAQELWTKMEHDLLEDACFGQLIENYNLDDELSRHHVLCDMYWMALRGIEIILLSQTCGKEEDHFYIFLETAALPYVAARHQDSRILGYRTRALNSPQGRPGYSFDNYVRIVHRAGAFPVWFATIRFLCRNVALAVSTQQRKQIRVEPEEAARSVNIAVHSEFNRFKPDSLSDLYWFYGARIESKTIFLITQIRYDAESIAEMVQCGINLVRGGPIAGNGNAPAAGTTRKPLHEAIPLVGPSLRALVHGLLLCLGRVRPLLRANANTAWKHAKLLELAVRSHAFASTYRRLGIRIVVEFQDIDVNKTAKAQAIKWRNGIMVGAHNSCITISDPLIDKPYDALFVWGDFFTKHAYNRFSRTTHFPTGFPFDYTFGLLGHDPMSLRRSLPGRRLLGYMDQIPRLDMPSSPAAHRAVWRALTNLLARYDDLVIVIKPKRDTGYLDNLCGDFPDLTAFRDQGRIIVAKFLRDDLVARPSFVGDACDVIVGLGLNSAAIECYFAGRPTFLFDPARIRSDFLSSIEHAAPVCHDTDELEQAVAEYLDKTGAVERPDTMSEFYSMLDPYQDGCAYQRMGFVITTLQHQLLNNSSPANAIAEARRALAAGEFLADSKAIPATLPPLAAEKTEGDRRSVRVDHS